MVEVDGRSPTYTSLDLVLLFRRAIRRMTRIYHRSSYARHAQEHMLWVIRERGPLKQSELQELLDIRSSSLSEVLGKLERNGLITRTRNEKDKRSFILCATPDAETSLSGRREGVQKNADTLFACLDAGERRQLGNILEKIIESLGAGCSGCDFSEKKHGRGRQCHPRKGWSLFGQADREPDVDEE